ncbi:MAG: hypothetical protein IMY86_11550 [Chloroflexi bacterium]|nr:hypothetical protein [Chloroflexota bacterium]
MMPGRHATVSLGVGLLGWWWSRSPATLPLSLVVGTLVDLDHVADYLWYALVKEHRLILPLHAYELAFPLWWTVRQHLGQRAAIVVVASYLLHLLSDELENRTKPGACSLIWRLVNGFRIESLSRDPVAGMQGRREDLDRLKRLVSRLRGAPSGRRDAADSG